MQDPRPLPAGPDPVDAAGWFVALDAAPRDAKLEARYAAWLAASPAHERAVQRIEIALEVTRRLAADPGLTAEISRRDRRAARLRIGGLAAGVALAAAMAMLWLAPWARLARAPLVPAELTAMSVAAVTAPVNPTVVLPSGVLVDGRSVAVLPFTGNDALAAGFEQDVVAALRSVPGLYVVAGTATAPYRATTELSAAEIGSQLGAASIADGEVTRSGARVQLVVRLRDARTGATVWRSALDEPVDRLAHLRDEIADGIALALLAPDERTATSREFGEPSLATQPIERPDLSD
jgi:TolB-like protein